MMAASDRGQVSRSAAEVYEEFFVPALFRQWVQPVADAADIRAGDRVLDVACGTGILARHAATRVGAAGSVCGVDINEGMLAVARREAPEIEWRKGAAEALPFADDGFDAVVSQFGLMFFADQAKAIREMRRVLRPGGRLAVAVWDSLANTPGYAAMTALLQRGKRGTRAGAPCGERGLTRVRTRARVLGSLTGPLAGGRERGSHRARRDATRPGARVRGFPGTWRLCCARTPRDVKPVRMRSSRDTWLSEANRCHIPLASLHHELVNQRPDTS